MMKKTYITPLVEVYDITDEDILAGSPSFSDGEVMSGDAKIFDFAESEDIDLGSVWSEE